MLINGRHLSLDARTTNASHTRKPVMEHLTVLPMVQIRPTNFLKCVQCSIARPISSSARINIALIMSCFAMDTMIVVRSVTVILNDNFYDCKFHPGTVIVGDNSDEEQCAPCSFGACSQYCVAKKHPPSGHNYTCECAPGYTMTQTSANHSYCQAQGKPCII